jgi:hypothetical protein
MRLFLTDAGGWLHSVAHGSQEWSRGYRESSAGSGGQRVCNGCTWACFTCVLPPVTHATGLKCCNEARSRDLGTSRLWELFLASVICSAVQCLVVPLFVGCLSLMQVDGWTALHMAAANGHIDVVKALLAAGPGANVSATTTVRGLVSRVYIGKRYPRCIGLVV